ncbi:MAG: hypothetical protein ABIJ59_14060 [Pseudomonadota bacterium]
MITSVDKKLVRKLIENGIEYSMIPGFIRSLVNAFLINPDMSHYQANKRLKYLGWGDIEIDYHTLQLAISSLEAKGLSQLEYKSAPWYVNGFDTRPKPYIPHSPAHC